VSAGFPKDWLSRASIATDLDLAVLVINTLDLLEDPPDRLSDLAWLTSAYGQVGHAALAADLSEADLPRLRELRSGLRTAFGAPDVAAAAAALNPMLESARTVFLLVPHGSVGAFVVDPSRRGVDALEARLPAAVAQHIAQHGVERLGVCVGDPCRCVFVDRTRAGTRRYCCTWCNDRTAARAYRARRRA
jgi:predicted RNA-binding Zn ribbon-like protein